MATFELCECRGAQLRTKIALRGNASATCGCVNVKILSKEVPLHGWRTRPLLLRRHWQEWAEMGVGMRKGPGKVGAAGGQ